MGNWIEKKLYDLSPANFNLLLAHKIPAIRLPNYLDAESCGRVAERLVGRSFASYDHLNDIPVHHLGICQNQLAEQDKAVYFGKIPEATKLIADLFAGICEDPIPRLLTTLSAQTARTARIFEEEGYGPYFAGAFRSFSGHGKLHIDHAPSHVKSDWDIKKISNQLTWNLYFSVLANGGELLIYDTVHNSRNENQKVAGEYYFPYSVLEGEQHIRIKPQVGDLIIFNTQNFHEILGNRDGRRISQTSFMGIRDDGSINLWS